MAIVTLLLILPFGVLANVTFPFEKGSLGTVFSPYNKFGEDKSSATYPISEIETMLELLSTRFQRITTYGMGTKSTTSVWNDTNDAEGLSALAAARINQKLKTLALTIEIGVHLHPNREIMKQEVKNALDAAMEANKLFNGTVSAIIMGTDYAVADLIGVYYLIQNYRDRAKDLSLAVGIRSHECHNIKSIGIEPYGSQVLYLINNLDFLICHVRPGVTLPLGNISKAVDVIGNDLLKWREDLREVSYNIKIFGETGFHSRGTSSKGVLGSVEDMKLFWSEMTKWSQINEFRMDLFSAFDDPTNTVQAEAHYGWWKRIRNDTNGEEAFAEKIYYPEPEPTNLPRQSFWSGIGSLEIGLGLLGTFVFLVLFASIGLLYRKLRNVKTQLLSQLDIKEFEQGVDDMNVDGLTEDALRLPYDRSYEMSKTQFTIDKAKLLGSGEFGLVYQGTLEDNPNDVAFKMTRPECTSNTLKSLLSEIKVMIHVGKHLNVVALLGAYTGEMRQGIIVIATELCDLGSLEKHLRTVKTLTQPPLTETVHYANDISRPVGIQLDDLIKWSYQISCGMLHIASKNVIHADLAIRNVLLTGNGTVKITDFGLSRRLYEYTDYVKKNQEPLPWRWMALESLLHMQFSTKSDVWAFSITLWEIFSMGEVPYPGLEWSVEFTQELRRGLRMNRPQHATPEIYSKLLECWNDDPDQRPDFGMLKEFFETTILRNENSIYQEIETHESEEH